ncbi:hypothetical protein G6F42_017380 [Rhizopus arrhizus]|nr:hypothetical protein G6F42_017380 [Rhizopus arrhizus]
MELATVYGRFAAYWNNWLTKRPMNLPPVDINYTTSFNNALKASAESVNKSSLHARLLVYYPIQLLHRSQCYYSTTATNTPQWTKIVKSTSADSPVVQTRTELCKHLVAVDIEQKRDLDVFFPAGNTAALLIYENFLSEILQHLAVGILIVQHDFDSSDAKHVRDPECALMPPAPQLFRIAQVLYTDRCAFMLRYIHKYSVGQLFMGPVYGSFYTQLVLSEPFFKRCPQLCLIMRAHPPDYLPTVPDVH